MYVIILSITSLSVLLYWLLQGQRSGIRQNGARLPSPPGILPFAGHGLWFLQPRHRLLAWFADAQPQMGLQTYEIVVPSLPPAILVNDPRNVEHILRHNELFVKGTFFRSRSWDLFGNGIINADGDLWRVQRKAGLRFFSNANLKIFIDEVLPPVMANVRQQLDLVAEKQSVVDMQEILLEITTRVMGKMAYDMDMDGSLPFSKAFDYASGVINDRFSNPLFKLKEWLFGSRFRASIEEVKSFGATMVTAAMAKRSASPSTKPHSPLQNNLINSLLDHISDPTTVADAAMNFLSAGRDTTAQALTWTFYLLSRHPNITTQIRHELAHLHPNHPSSAPLTPSYQLVTSTALPYTLAVFSESLRLHPPVPFELKESIAPTTFPDGTLLPAGSVALWVPWSMGRSTAIWGADALRFRPERWLARAADDGAWRLANVKTAFEHPVFNAGPRMCLGKKMAESLALAVLASVLWEWDVVEVLERAEGGCGIGGERVCQESLTLPMEGGLPVRIRRRDVGGDLGG